MRRGTGGKGKGEAGGSQQSPQQSPPPSPQHSSQPQLQHSSQPQLQPQHSSQPSQPHPQHSSQPQPSPQNNMLNVEQARMQRTVIGMDATRNIVADIVKWRALIEAAIDGKLSAAEDVIRGEEECRKLIADAEKRLVDTRIQAYEGFMQDVSTAKERMLEKVNTVQNEVASVIDAAQLQLATLTTGANTNATLALGREMSNEFQDAIYNMRALLQQRMEPHTAILNQPRAAQEN